MSKYFIVKNSVKHGPLTFEELKNYKLSKSDLIWKEGNEDWVKAEELNELTEIIQPEIPKTPFEKKSDRTIKSLKTNIFIPIIIGIIMGFMALFSWDSVKSTVYKNKPQVTYSGAGIETRYEKYMDKYLAGEYGFSALRDNENFYYENTDQGFFRPLNAVLSQFNSKTQFFVGKDEPYPIASFLLLWIVYCMVIYLLIYGIIIAIQRSKN